MKWLMLISSIDAQDGGPALAMLELATALAEQGHQIHLCALTVSDSDLHPALNHAKATGVHVHLTPVRRRTTFRYSPWFLSSAIRASVGANVVTLHGFYQFSTIVAFVVAVTRQIPLLIEPHGIFEPYQESRGNRLKPVFMRLVGRRVIKRSRSIMVASKQEERGVWTTLRSTVHRITVVGLGVSVPETPPVKRDFTQRTLLFLSRVAPKKRLDKTLEAARLLAERGEPVHLTICGDGDPDYLAQLRAIDVAESAVTWAGHVDGPTRRHIEARQSLFVLASDNENFGLAVIQAMAAGLPVITTTDTGASEHVLAAGAGWILSAPSAVDLADAIALALSDASELERRATAGREYARRSLTWTHVAELWADVAR